MRAYGWEERATPIDVARTLTELQSREQIRGVIEQSIRGLDRIDRAMILGAYVDGAVEEHAHFTGTVEKFAEFVCGERAARFASSTHLTGMPSVELHGEIAFAATSCVVHRVTAPDPADDGPKRDFVSGVRFLDRLERRNGRWRIVHRTCVGDWAYTVPVESGMLPEGDSRLNGRRDQADVWYEWSASHGEEGP